MVCSGLEKNTLLLMVLTLVTGDLVLELLQLLSDFSLEIKQAGAYIAIQNSAPFAESQKSSNLLQNYIDEYHKSAATLLRYTQPSPIWDYRNDSVFTT